MRLVVTLAVLCTASLAAADPDVCVALKEIKGTAKGEASTWTGAGCEQQSTATEWWRGDLDGDKRVDLVVDNTVCGLGLASEAEYLGTMPRTIEIWIQCADGRYRSAGGGTARRVSVTKHKTHGRRDIRVADREDSRSPLQWSTLRFTGCLEGKKPHCYE
jgi:hypothetical protein